MASPFAGPILLPLALFIAAVAAAPQNDGCDCEATCAEIVVRQQQEIARLQAELRTLRGDGVPLGRRLSCLSYAVVSSNAAVAAFGLEGCRDVKVLQVSGNVTSLASLSGLISTAELVEIRDTQLQSLVGLEGLEHAVSVVIQANGELQSLAGLESLSRVDVRLEISQNDQLRSLTSLQGLEYAESIVIQSNGGLQSLTGLEKLSRVGRELTISQNDQLRSLTGFQGLEYAWDVRIRSNGALQSLTELENLTFVEFLSIDHNNQLTSLDGLQGLQTAEMVFLTNNSKLQSLAGLQGLEHAGVVYIQFNDELQSLTGLENLWRVDQEIRVEKNGQLRSLAGLQGLETAVDVAIQGNSGLQSLAGLENLVRVEGRLLISSNWPLQSLDGLGGLESADEIHLESGLLLSLSGLDSLTHVGKLSLVHLSFLRSIAPLRNLISIWHGGLLIRSCDNLLSLDGLGMLRASLVEVAYTPLQFLGGPFATGSSVHSVQFEPSSWPPCVTPHERMSLLSVAVDKDTSSVPNATWEPDCGPNFGTFLCTKGQPCNFSLAGEGRNYASTRIFISARFVGCGACSVNHLRADVGEGGRVNLGYALRNEEAGLRSVCRCTDWRGIGPVAQLLLRGPRQSVTNPCIRGRNCSVRVDGEGLESTDRVVLMSSCSSGNPRKGFPASWTAANAYLLHDRATWYAATAGVYQVCWRAPCSSAPDGPTCPAPEDSYLQVGEVQLFGAYLRNYTAVLGENFSVPNIGLGVNDSDHMRLRRVCGEANKEQMDALAASSSEMVFDFGRLTETRVEAGIHRLCACQERNGAKCNAELHFTADAGVVQVWCPAGQEFINSRHCERCPAGKHGPTPGLEPCTECPPGQFAALGGGERCEACPGGKVAARTGSSACVACRGGLSADAEAAGCSPDPALLVLFACFLLSVGALVAILVHGIRRQLLVVDVSLVEKQTIITTFRPHGFRNRGDACFPVTLQGTGHPDLDSPSAHFKARVKSTVCLELLSQQGESMNHRVDTSMGTLTVAFPHDLHHQLLVAVGVPLLSTVVLALGGLVLLVGMRAEALLGAATVALSCTAAMAAVRHRPRFTPLDQCLSEFKQKLAKQHHSPCAKGPNRAIEIGRLHELLQVFHIFIRDRTAYYLNSNITKRLTEDRNVSYAELVGAGEVEWFVSHFWGTSFQHFCVALQKHAESVCGLREWTELRYWVCFCSNNQHRLQEELGEGRWEESSFYLTLKSGCCRGTCMVLDDQALPLTRIWCIFELLQTVKLERKDPNFQGLLLCTTGGVLNNGGGSAEVAVALAEKVAGVDLQTAKASSQKDADTIRAQVIREMGSFEKLNRFVCRVVRDMLVRAQHNVDRQFAGVLARLTQATKDGQLNVVRRVRRDI